MILEPELLAALGHPFLAKASSKLAQQASWAMTSESPHLALTVAWAPKKTPVFCLTAQAGDSSRWPLQASSVGHPKSSSMPARAKLATCSRILPRRLQPTPLSRFSLRNSPSSPACEDLDRQDRRWSKFAIIMTECASSSAISAIYSFRVASAMIYTTTSSMYSFPKTCLWASKMVEIALSAVIYQKMRPS